MSEILDRLDVLDDNTLAIVSEVSTDDLRTLADHCANVRNSGKVKATQDAMPVASAPRWVVMDYCNRKGISWQQFMSTNEFDLDFLNSTEMQAFRLWSGCL